MAKLSGMNEERQLGYSQLLNLRKSHEPKWRGDQPLIIWCWLAEWEQMLLSVAAKKIESGAA